MNESKWYVLKVISGQEYKIKCQLNACIAEQKLENAIQEILIPTEKIYVMRNGKKSIKDHYFFPGYLFIKADFTCSDTVYFLIEKIRNIIGFLTVDGRYSKSKMPIALRESEVKRIIGKMDNTGKPKETEKLDNIFVEGETIKVIDGPFVNFTGNIQKVLEERGKVIAVVKIFNRNTPIELSYAQVEKIA